MTGYRRVVASGAGLILAAALANSPALAQMPDTPDGVTIAWKASNDTIQGLPREIQSLTLSLLNSGVLQTRISEVPASDPRVSVMFDWAFPYLTWTDAAASLLCDLNTDQCDRPRVPIDTTQHLALDRHVLGTAISPADQVVMRPKLHEPSMPRSPSENGVYRLTVPSIEFQYAVNWRPVLIDTIKEPPSAVYLDRSLGCRGVVAQGMEFAFTGQLPALLEELRTEFSGSCPLEIYLRNYGALGFALEKSRKYSDTPRSEAAREVQMLLDNFEQRIIKADYPWVALDGIAAEVGQVTGDPRLVMQLPVLAVTAEAATPVGRFNDLETSQPATSVEENPSDLALDHLRGAIGRLKAHVQDLHVIQQKAPLELRLDNASDVIEAMKLDSDALIEKKMFVLAGQRRLLFDHINFPAAEGPELSAFANRIIVIVDQGFAPGMKHCAFLTDFDAENGADCDSHAALWDSGALPPPPAFPEADDPVNPAVRDYFFTDPLSGRRARIALSHGQAVASVAAARLESGTMIGIDPLAFTVPFEVNLDNAELALGPVDFPNRVEAKRNEALSSNFYETRLHWQNVVWNLSLHFEKLGDSDPARPLLSYIRENCYGQHAPDPSLEYFVFAAGNVAADVLADDLAIEDCRVFPACLVARGEDLGTMVTVVGARVDENDVAELWRSADGETVSYANPAFQVAAIAEDVPVALTGKGTAYALDSGTSYAAPQVSALISALRASGIHHPTVIQARLMGCARMSTKLLGSVRGGLIDVACTLDFKRAQMAYDDGDPAHLELRPGVLLNIWKQDSTRGKGQPTGMPPNIGGIFADVEPVARPNVERPTLAGFRTLSDDERLINMVGWRGKPPEQSNTSFSHAEVLTETRVPLRDNRIFEFLFNGEDKPVCVRLFRVTQFIHADPEFAKDLRDGPGPNCDPSELAEF